MTTLHLDFLNEDNTVVTLHMSMDRAGCPIQQGDAKQWLFGRNFSRYRESSRSNLCLYIAIYDCRAVQGVPSDVLLEIGEAQLLKTSLEIWFELIVVPCCFLLGNTSQQTSVTEPSLGHDFRWEEWGISLLCFPAGKTVTTGNVFLPLYAFVWRQERFYHLLLLLPNCRIKHLICISYTIFTMYEE